MIVYSTLYTAQNVGQSWFNIGPDGEPTFILFGNILKHENNTKNTKKHKISKKKKFSWLSHRGTNLPLHKNDKIDNVLRSLIHFWAWSEYPQSLEELG